MSYEELLKRGMAKVPKNLKEHGRFVAPRAVITPAGARTYIDNFNDIARDLRREPAHLLKFILKELATKGEFEGKRLVVLGRFPETQINAKIDLYIKQYVICPECVRPDTKIVKDGDFHFLKCEACGAKQSLGK